MFNLLADNWRPLGLDRYGSPSRFSWSLLTPTPCHGGARNLVMLLLDRASTRPVLVAKLARLPGDHAYLDREIEALRQAHAVRPAGFDSIPRVVATAQIAGRRLLVETALEGKQMTPRHVRRRFDECAGAVTDWLVEFNRATAAPRRVDLAALIEAPLDNLAPMLLRSADDETLARLALDAVAPLRDACLPAVFEHGDLFYPNVLMRERGIGVLDWETGERYALPAGDLFFFLGQAAFARARKDDDLECVGPFDDAFFPAAAWARPSLRRYVDALALDAGLLTPLFVAFWTRFLLTKAARMASRLSDAQALSRSAALDDLSADLRRTRDYHVWRHTLLNLHRLEWHV